MPRRLASRTLSRETFFPSMWISPSSGSCAPPKIFINVLLPAPFSPIKASTSPTRSERETPWSAITPGNRFVIALISSKFAPCDVTSLLHLGELLLEGRDVRLVDHIDARVDAFVGRNRGERGRALGRQLMRPLARQVPEFKRFLDN